MILSLAPFSKPKTSEMGTHSTTNADDDGQHMGVLRIALSRIILLTHASHKRVGTEVPNQMNYYSQLID